MSQNTPANHLISVFEAQKKHQYIVANQSVRQRKEKLKKLKRALEITFRQQIREALHADMNKPIAETDLIEIYPVVSEIKLALKNLKSWTKNHLVDTPLAFLGSRSYIAYEPKGVCLIISPWNYPVNLTLGPLVSAIAAGNTVLIKPSEHTPHTSALLQKIIASLFDEQEVAVMEGGVETSRELLKLPFDHIFFTGSPDVGKHVMAAAAQNLASVTLELGGKSPTIVDQTASVKTAARRIAWGKFVNCGQTCIAPDYVFVHHAIADSFLEALTQSIATLYDREDAFTTDYARIATQKHTERLTSLLDDAKSRGAEIVTGAPSEAISRLIKPIVLKNVNPESEL
ncbi:MAG: aldehyde dehydrogenase family protein, partial [Cyclobacteriaceae bacterium]|nr:aldehyde dehydrogenase family protein [Cyclobacteriaceae bacterium]